MASTKSRNKKPSKKRFSVTVKAAIIGGIIGLIGVITAAIITVNPDIFDLTSEKNLITTTPVSFTRYDDPLGIFSIEYPSNYAVVPNSNQKIDQGFVIQFAPIESLESPEGNRSKYGSIFVSAIRKKILNKDISVINDGTLNELPFLRPYDSFVLISNKKTEKGFLVHYKFVDNKFKDYNVHAYLLIEFDESSVFGVAYFVLDESLAYYQNILEHTFSSISWYPSRVEEYFPLTK